MLSNSAAKKLMLLRNLKIFIFFFFFKSKHLQAIKLQIILLPISFQVLGNIQKHHHMNAREPDSSKRTSNKNLPQIFTQLIN